jgi:hypothetical protein
VVDQFPDAPSETLLDHCRREAVFDGLPACKCPELALSDLRESGFSMRALGPHMSPSARINSGGV